MKYIIKDKNTSEVVKHLNKYPNINEGVEIIGFDYSNFDIYIVIEVDKPTYDPNIEYLKYQETFTDTLHDTYYNIKICNHEWLTTDLNNDTILIKLNESLGLHLDTEYPLWERAKHAGEGNYILWDKTEGGLTQEQIDRKAYIDTVYAWITTCRADRDTRESELINNSITPSFVWTNRPI